MNSAASSFVAQAKLGRLILNGVTQKSTVKLGTMVANIACAHKRGS